MGRVRLRWLALLLGTCLRRSTACKLQPGASVVEAEREKRRKDLARDHDAEVKMVTHLCTDPLEADQVAERSFHVVVQPLA